MYMHAYVFVSCHHTELHNTNFTDIDAKEAKAKAETEAAQAKAS